MAIELEPWQVGVWIDNREGILTDTHLDTISLAINLGWDFDLELYADLKESQSTESFSYGELVEIQTSAYEAVDWLNDEVGHNGYYFVLFDDGVLSLHHEDYEELENA